MSDVVDVPLFEIADIPLAPVPRCLDEIIDRAGYNRSDPELRAQFVANFQFCSCGEKVRRGRQCAHGMLPLSHVLGEIQPQPDSVLEGQLAFF